jgi:hypothetical protein
VGKKRCVNDARTTTPRQMNGPTCDETLVAQEPALWERVALVGTAIEVATSPAMTGSGAKVLNPTESCLLNPRLS